MHISEGVLTGEILLVGYTCALLGTGVGLRKMDLDKIVEAGMFSAVFFVASVIHVPIGFSNAHLTLSGLIGLLMGWSAFPIIVAALIIQAMMLQYGGITTLGINTLIMAVPAIFSYYVFAFLVYRSNFTVAVAAFTCGMFSVLIGVSILSTSLFLSHSSFKSVAWITMIAHLPIMIIEGIVTACCVVFLAKVKPEILPGYLNSQSFGSNSN